MICSKLGFIFTFLLFSPSQSIFVPEKSIVASEKSGIFIGATVVVEKIRPRKSPGGEELTETLQWGSRSNYCVEKFQKNDENWYLLVKNPKRSENEGDQFDPVGWIPEWAVIIGNKSLLNENAGDGSGLQRKAALINSEESIKEDPSRKEVAPSLGPGRKGLKTGDPNYTKTSPLRFFNYLFVYAQLDDFYLLGTAPVFGGENDTNSFKNVVRGWFPKNVVLEWDTREAVEYSPNSKRTLPTQFFLTINEALEFAANPRGRIQGKKPIVERMSVKDGITSPIAFSPRQPRYPLLKENGKILERKDPKKDGPGNLGFLKKVGVIGGFFNPDNPDNFIEANDFQAIMDKLNKVSQSLQKTELLLIIDDTTSMKDYLRVYVPEIIENVVKAISENDQELKLSVVFYNDLENEEDLKKPNPDLTKAVDCSLGTTKFTKGVPSKDICEAIRKRKPNGGGGGPREQVFHGITTGLTMATLQSDPLSRKICIVIGDYANHKTKTNNEVIEEISKLLVPDSVAKEFLPWEFLGLQVPQSKNDKQNGIIPTSDYLDFHLQMEAIASKARERWLGFINTRQKNTKATRKISPEAEASEIFQAIPGSDLDDGQKVTKDISERYKKIAVQTKNDELAVKEFILTGLGGSQISDSLREILAVKGIDVAVLSGKGAQIFVPAYAWEKNVEGQKQFQEMVLVDRDGFQEIQKVLAIFQNNQLENISKALIDNLTQVQAGEGKGGKFTELPKYKGLQLNSPLLQISKKDKEQIEKNLKEGSQELKILKKKRILLEEIQNNTKSNWKWETDNLGNADWVRDGVSKPIKTRFFRFNSTDQLEYIWLDWIEEFP